MRRIIIFGLLLIGRSNISFCADNYKPGDSLFVWAENGLRLRSEPSTKSKIITTVKFGESVKVVEKSNVSYNFNLIPGLTNKIGMDNTDPIILFGHWVKVTVASNVTGYVIDQYLLSIIPNKPIPGNEWVLKLISIDTVFKNPIPQDGSALNLTVKKSYQNNISALEYSGGSWGGAIYTFDEFTIEEVLIFFSKSTEEFKNFTVWTNLANEIVISDNSMIQVTIKSKNGTTTYEVMGGC